MTLPVHHRPGRLLERPFPALSWGEPLTAEFDDLFERMNRFLQATGTAPAVGAWSPLADLHETDDAYAVEAELPGIKREDIDVEVSERELFITGDYKECGHEGVLRHSTATLADGVLTVTVPKAQAAKPHHIEITQA
ncbi:Hsp20/alpha crystallin family protein [Streptomyces malaysiense]|uniref:Heat-shock protein Hsp20 n=1 Tax=Streptomyces malaysiense TaxID=1428626 RepID=A0A1J4PZC0_9ACTN|nr:Hsp20/alpha crystallin family protein [Streptomyces malaysiense]OIK26291.1 heat-shock protein Hsp20 [Streptomyces malaysiense]